MVNPYNSLTWRNYLGVIILHTSLSNIEVLLHEFCQPLRLQTFALAENFDDAD